jgi:hypothetical protein
MKGAEIDIGASLASFLTGPKSRLRGRLFFVSEKKKESSFSEENEAKRLLFSG